METKAVLPPWGDGPAPARPLSPKRRPKAKAAPTLGRSLRAGEELASLRDGGLAGLLRIVGAAHPVLVGLLVLVGAGSLAIVGFLVLVSQRAPEAVTNIAASIQPVRSNIPNYDQGENYLSDIQSQNYLLGGDAFIFADVPSPSGLANYSAGLPVQTTDALSLAEGVAPSPVGSLENYLSDIQVQNYLLGGDAFIFADVPSPSGLALPVQTTDAIVNLDLGILPSTSEAPHVLMGKLKLEEVGTMWSQPRLPVAAILPSPDVSFRPSAETHPDRSWTYQLQWWATPQEERPLMYKLQWWTNRDDLLITQDMLPDHDLLLVSLQHSLPSPQAHELRWRK